MNEYLRRIDERDYLTEREHREYLRGIEQELKVAEHFRIVKLYIERMYIMPFYRERYGRIEKWVKGTNFSVIDYNFENDCIDIFDYELELSIKVDEIEKEVIFFNEDIEAQYQKQEEETNKRWAEKYEKFKKDHNIKECAMFNCTSTNKGEK